MILVDSSGWIAYLAERPHAEAFARYIEGAAPLVSSTIQIYEIYEVVKRNLSEDRAIAAVSALRGTTIEPVSETIALEAADIALELRLAMADAIIFATAARHEAEIVTGVSDFDAASRARRRFALPCLDWTEREAHLGGSLGAELCRALVERGWIARQPDTRAVLVTAAGRRGLKRSTRRPVP